MSDKQTTGIDWVNHPEIVQWMDDPNSHLASEAHFLIRGGCLEDAADLSALCETVAQIALATRPAVDVEGLREKAESTLFDMLTEIHQHGDSMIQGAEILASFLDGEDPDGGEIGMRLFCSDFAEAVFTALTTNTEEGQ